jgi:predicted amidohydrolase
MKIAVVQTNPAFGEISANVAGVIDQIRSAPADLYVLPELFNTGYNFIDAAEAARLSEGTDGPTCSQLVSLAAERSCWIAFGFAEKTGGKYYNSAALVNGSGVAAVYRKVHLFAREKLFFSPGDLGFPVFETPFGTVGMMICFDWYFPESARTLAAKGARLIIHPSNLVMPYCPDAMVTRCLENRVFSATANRIGTENRGGSSLGYIGTSEIVAPNGKILQRLTDSAPGVAVAEINLEDAANKRLNPFNDIFEDRRPEFYGA